jgi:glycosyltransferase involved in cell wall biosynthesis
VGSQAVFSRLLDVAGGRWWIVKLIIQIPCYNEAATLTTTLDDLPTSIPGIDQIEILIVDDGSTDDTVRVAREWGVHHVVSHVGNKGLATAFMTGLATSLSLGADIIVNTDADNQYKATHIPLLVGPILMREAEIVIGARPIGDIEHFSPLKKGLQKLGSAVVRWVSDTNVTDAPSGFRALSRQAAMQINVFSQYTYTLETIIQAGAKNIPVVSVPIGTNADLRPSRLVKSLRSYVRRSVATMGHVFVIYRPFRFLGVIAGILLAAGVLLGARYIYFVMVGEGKGHVQSVILAGVLLLMGFNTLSLAVIANLISVNRRLIEDVQVHLRELRLSKPR